MFKLFYEPKQVWVTIYHIRDDKSGYPNFLVYLDKQWIYKSAKYFRVSY
jgi:hypothetical protein